MHGSIQYDKYPETNESADPDLAEIERELNEDNDLKMFKTETYGLRQRGTKERESAQKKVLDS